MKRPNILKIALLGSTAVMLPPPPPPSETTVAATGYKVGDTIRAGNLKMKVTGVALDGKPIVIVISKPKRRKKS